MSDKCKFLHEMLEKIPLIKYPFDVNRLPNNGIYFFYEKNELQIHNNKPRIVRVGTHNKDNFQSRISDHYVSDSKMKFGSNKSPPHDRSIFRKNIGRAILNKKENSYLKIWDIDFTSRKNREKYSHFRDISLEKRIENEVSELLHNNFSFRFIIIEEQNERKGTLGMESRIIGTLSKCSICYGSENWLGNYSPKEKIRKSGLWLEHYLNSEEITPQDIEKLYQYADNTKSWIDNFDRVVN